MKSLRYLLILTMMVTGIALSVNAQGIAQQPNADFQSTSGMTYSGSTLPMAAQSGIHMTDDESESGTGFHPGRPRRVNDDDTPGTEPGQQSPIGDGLWALLLLALAYGGYMVYRRRKVALHR